MDTFPYDSWEEAVAAAQSDAASAPYFTFGVGTTLTILTILGMALALGIGFYLVANEAKHLNEAADRLTTKYARN